MEERTPEGLLRVMRRWDVAALAINAIIGAGIFGLPSEVFRRTGAWSLPAFLVCGGIVTLIIVSFAEVASRFSGTGGPYLYARTAFGSLVGFEVGWLIWIARVTAFAANANLLVGYAGYFWPGSAAPAGRTVILVLLTTGLAAVNVTGVRNATLVSNLFTVAKLLPLLLFVGAGVFFVQGSRYDFSGRPPLGEFSAAVLVLVYAFSGFEMATISGGETRDPRRDIPGALMIAIGVVSVLYFLIQLVSIGTLPGLAGSTRPLADAGRSFLGPLGGGIISAGALISILGNLNVIIMVGARLPFAMAEQRELPRFLSATHPRFHTPHRAIYLTAVVVLVLALTGTFVYAATVSVIARLLSYGATCAALPVLRRRRDAPPAAFRAPGGIAVSTAALVLIGWLLSYSTASQARDAGIAAGVGILVYGLSRRGRAPGDSPPGSGERPREVPAPSST